MIPTQQERVIKTDVTNTSIEVTETNPIVFPDPFHVTVDNPTTIPNPVPVSFSSDYVQKVINEDNDSLHTTIDNQITLPSSYDVNVTNQVTLPSSYDVNVLNQVTLPSIYNVLSKGEYRYIYSKKFLSTEATISITLPINVLANDLIRLNDVFVDTSTGYLSLEYTQNPNINPDDFYMFNETNNAYIFVNKSNAKCLSTGFIKIINNVDAGNVVLKLFGAANITKFFDVEVYRLS